MGDVGSVRGDAPGGIVPLPSPTPPPSHEDPGSNDNLDIVTTYDIYIRSENNEFDAEKGSSGRRVASVGADTLQDQSRQRK